MHNVACFTVTCFTCLKDFLATFYIKHPPFSRLPLKQMSTIPDDLAVASEFAAQDLPPATIVKAEPTKTADPAATSNAEAAPVNDEPVSNQHRLVMSKFTNVQDD